MSMSVSIETITPNDAAELLKTNLPNNRPIAKNNLQKYADEMKSGDWAVTGDPIRISDKGYLIDGQHRLIAVTRTGLAMEFVVVRGVPHESFVALDQGKMRSLSDVLHTLGYERSRDLAKALNEANFYERYMNDKVQPTGEPFRTRTDKAPYTAGAGGNSQTTRGGLLDLLTRRPSLVDATDLAATFGRASKTRLTVVPVGTAAVLIDIASIIDRAGHAVDFLEEVTTGQSEHPHLAGNNPALLYHAALVRARGGSPTYKLGQTQKRGMLFRAYEAWAMGDELQRLPRPLRSYPSVPGDVEWHIVGRNEPR